MSRRNLLTLLCAGIGLALLLAPGREVLSQTIERVIVTNFPPLQRIEGEVTIESPVRLSELVSFEEIVVPPVKRGDTTRLVEAGTLGTDGFPEVVLSLHGEVKGSVHKPGRVGAILIPDEPTIQEAFTPDTSWACARRSCGTSRSGPRPRCSHRCRARWGARSASCSRASRPGT